MFKCRQFGLATLLPKKLAHASLIHMEKFLQPLTHFDLQQQVHQLYITVTANLISSSEALSC